MHTPEKNNNRGSLLFICALRLSLPLSLTTLNPYALWRVGCGFGFRLEGTTAFNRSFHGNLNTYMHTYTHVRGKRAGLNSPNCSLTQKVIRWTLWELKRYQSTFAKTGILDWKAIKLYFILVFFFPYTHFEYFATTTVTFVSSPSRNYLIFSVWNVNQVTTQLSVK